MYAKSTNASNKVILFKPVKLYYGKRFMMSSKCYSVACSAYHLMHVLSHPSMFDHLKKNNKIITDALTNYSLDNTQGVIAHKSKLLMHILAGKYPASDIYEAYRRMTNNVNVSCASIDTDTRVFAELPVLSALQAIFGSDITSIQANIDSSAVPPGTYAGLKQTNPDWKALLMLKKLWEQSNVSGYNNRPAYYDQKSGTDMFRHSTSGSIGMLPYDSSGNPIQIMSKPFPLEDLLERDWANLDGIFWAMQNDRLKSTFPDTIKNNARNILQDSSMDMPNRHNAYQRFVWDNIQLHPKYNRSVSLIFVETVDFKKGVPEYDAFVKEFQSTLGEKTYDLDKRGDSIKMSFAMLQAYERTVDPQIVKKITHLQKEGIVMFNKKFVEDLYKLTKEHVNHYT